MKEKIKEILLAMYDIGHADGIFRPKAEHTKEWVVPDIFADEIIKITQGDSKYEEAKEFAKSIGVDFKAIYNDGEKE